MLNQKAKELKDQQEKLNNDKKSVISEYEEELRKLSQKFDQDTAALKG